MAQILTEPTTPTALATQGSPVPPAPAGPAAAPDIDIPSVIGQYRAQSERARRSRHNLNKRNWDLYHGKQDFSHKQAFQSQEFMPDLPIAIEQICGVIERALTDFNDWYELSPVNISDFNDSTQAALLDPVVLQKFMSYFLDRLWQPGEQPDTSYGFPLLVSDAVKMGVNESLVTLKVYGVDDVDDRYRLEAGERVVEQDFGNGDVLSYTVPTQVVQRIQTRKFRIAIDIIPWEDFFPDPSGNNLFVIHEVDRPIHELRANPSYDPEVIDALEARTLKDAEADAEKRRRNAQDQSDSVVPTVRVREFWGDVVDPKTGTLLHKNVLITTVEDKYLLRKPTPNPFWHGKRPFVSAPLIRVPLSKVHKALVDHAGPMAMLINEVMNLMIDGAIASTWGTRQVRADLLENPEDIENGIPQAFTAVLKPGVPEGQKFLERVDSGEVPQFAAMMLQRIEQSFQVGLATPDLKLGILPPRQVKATEIVEAMQGSGSLFEGIVARTEDGVIVPTLELVWLTIWQYVNDFSTPEVVAILGEQRALALQRMTPAERFVRMASSVNYKVNGLRAILGRARDYQKLVTMLQVLSSNPALAMAFDKKYSVVKLLGLLMKSIGIDPSNLEKDMGAGPEFNIAALAGAGGAAPGGTGGPESQIEGAMAEANPDGFQGAQTPQGPQT